MGGQPLMNFLIVDDLPEAQLEYIEGSTTLNGYSIPDDTNGFLALPAG